MIHLQKLDVFAERRVTACNKITDAGVFKWITQAAPGYCSMKQPRILIHRRSRATVCSFPLMWCVFVSRTSWLPVREVVFVHVQESRGDVTGHPLKDQGLRGHGF